MIDAYRFRIIRDSRQKTDKRDAANLSSALWLASRSGEMRLPEVWQPGPVVRELRRLFKFYELLNKQIRQLRNQIHGVLLDNGVRDRALGNQMANNPARAEEWLMGVELSAASRKRSFQSSNSATLNPCWRAASWMLVSTLCLPSYLSYGWT